MAEFRFFCPCCGQPILGDTSHCGTQINCPGCRQSITVPSLTNSPAPPAGSPSAGQSSNGSARKIFLIAAAVVVLLLLLAGVGRFLYFEFRGKPAGLVAWWRAEGNARDSAGHNDGELVNASFTKGVAGQAFYLNGSNAFVQIPDSPSLKPASVTVEAWVRLDAEVSPVANSPGQQTIVFKKNTQNTMFEGYCLHKNRENGRDFFRFLVSSGSQQEMADSTTDAEEGAWYHLAGTYDYRTGDVKLYVNGVLEATTHAGFALSYGRRPLFIGTTGEWWDGKFDGAIDEVAIYDRALSAREIAALYHAGARRIF